MSRTVNTYVVKWDLDGLLIGPFSTYEDADNWAGRTVFAKAGRKWEITVVLTPRRDHLVKP